MAYLEQKILWRFNGGKEDWFLLCLFVPFYFFGPFSFLLTLFFQYLQRMKSELEAIKKC